MLSGKKTQTASSEGTGGIDRAERGELAVSRHSERYSPTPSPSIWMCDFGELDASISHFAALLYAGDRFESRAQILGPHRSHDLSIIDRYVASILPINQRESKAAVPRDFIKWLCAIEYGIYALS